MIGYLHASAALSQIKRHRYPSEKVRKVALNNYTKSNRILVIVDASHFWNQLHKSHLKY
jgi:hypothetical protein